MPHQILIAAEPWQYEDSDSILNFQYSKLQIPHDSQSPYLASGQATRMLVMRGATVAGSLDIIRPGPLALPMSHVYPAALIGLDLIGEVGRFSTDSLRPAELVDLLTETFERLAAMPGDVAVAGVHPSRARFYCRSLGARIAAPSTMLPGSDVVVILLTFTREGFRQSVLGRRRTVTCPPRQNPASVEETARPAHEAAPHNL